MEKVPEHVNKALNKAKIALMSRADSAFFTTLCFSLKLVWDYNVPTAQTNGLEIRISPDFFMELNQDEQVFLLIHETLHVAYLHLVRRGDRDPTRWNIAADHVINLQLIERGFSMPKGGLADECYSNMSVDEVYPLIPEQESIDGFGADLGDFEGSADTLEEDVKDILVRASVQSRIEGDAPGTIPGDIQIFLDKLLKPKLPWQRILQKYLQSFSKNDYTFKKPNRRFFPRHILPGLHSEDLMEIAIFVDTSGSVSDKEFLRFISEIHGILRMMCPDKITIGQFDHEIKSVDEVKNVNQLHGVTFTGRGGTCIEPVLEWADENDPTVLLVFTDGFFRFSTQKHSKDTVWLIHNNNRFKPPFGKTIHYEA